MIQCNCIQTLLHICYTLFSKEYLHTGKVGLGLQRACQVKWSYCTPPWQKVKEGALRGFSVFTTTGDGDTLSAVYRASVGVLITVPSDDHPQETRL